MEEELKNLLALTPEERVEALTQYYSQELDDNQKKLFNDWHNKTLEANLSVGAIAQGNAMIQIKYKGFVNG